MKKTVIISVCIVYCSCLLNAQLPQLSDKERKQGWILLFDGVTSNGWKKANGQPFPERGWKIENGVMSVDPANKGRDGGGDVVTEMEFSNFELSLEFKITKGANSGIKYFILPRSSLGCEFQILDDANHPDAKEGKNGNRLQGSLYDLIPPSPKKKDKPVGEWNHARIISKGQNVEHWLNGKKIVSYKRGSDAFNALVAVSKYRTEKNFATPARASILLQDHGDVVSFRNIKIKVLK